VTNEIEQLSCQELVELVTDYLEGALPEADRRRLEEHISGCEGCREYVGQIEAAVALTHDARTPSLTPQAEEALLAAFRNWKAT
jgi:anti-sigma factor RsiW